jgi:hypothetical protein
LKAARHIGVVGDNTNKGAGHTIYDCHSSKNSNQSRHTITIKKMKKNWKIVVTIVITLFSFLALAFLAGSISSGSFNYAQQYQFKASKAQLIKSIERYKGENKEYNSPLNYNAKDSLDDYTRNLTVYVYYPDQNSMVCFVIHSHEAQTSYIYLVSVNEGLKTPYYKRVNKDFDRADNLRIKQEFKERVLNKLGLSYKDKGNGMFIFWK